MKLFVERRPQGVLTSEETLSRAIYQTTDSWSTVDRYFSATFQLLMRYGKSYATFLGLVRNPCRWHATN